ncbi:MAG: hypothetical protein P1P93_02195 [Gammaproteobacteria bacterium]|nr:hypothetical protein [Gammaproteobacteria bacterium]
MSKQEQKYNQAADRYFNAFKKAPHFEGLTTDIEYSDDFIAKLNQAVGNNDPDIDLSDYLADPLSA